MARFEETSTRLLEGMARNEHAIEDMRGELKELRREVKDIRPCGIRARATARVAPTMAVHEGIQTIRAELNRGILTMTEKMREILREEIDPLKKSLARLETAGTYQNWVLGFAAVGIIGTLATLVTLVVSGFPG